VLLDHSRRPRNFGEIPGAVRVRGDNRSCGDEIQLDLLPGPDGAIADVKFTGQGCAISQASASLMTLKIKGKTRSEAEAMIAQFHRMVTDEAFEPARQLGDLRLLAGVRKFPQRVKCAMLAWRALEQALAKPSAGAVVSTEET